MKDAAILTGLEHSMESMTAPYPSLNTEAELTQPRLIALLFADWATQTQDGKIVLGGVFDKLTFRSGAPPVGAFFMYVRLAETYRDAFQVVLYEPDGQPTGEFNIDGRELTPTPGEPNFVQVFSRVVLELPIAGTWWFEVRYQGNPLGRVPLLIEHLGRTDGDID